MAIRSGAEMAARNKARQQTMRQAGSAVKKGLMTSGQAGGMIDPSMYGITNRNLQKRGLPLPDPSQYSMTPQGRYVSTGPGPIGSGQNGGYGGGAGGYGGPGGSGGNPGMRSQGWQYQGGPEEGMISDVYDNALNGGIQSYNRAANRLRERIDSSTAGNIADATQKNLGRGFGASGLQDRDVYRAQSAGQEAYGQGLVDLESEMEQNRLKGLSIAGDQAKTQSENTQVKNKLGLDNLNFIDKTLFDLLQSREGNQARQGLQDSNNKFLGKQSSLQRDYNLADRKHLEDMLNKVNKKNARSLPITSAWGAGANTQYWGRR